MDFRPLILSVLTAFLVLSCMSNKMEKNEPEVGLTFDVVVTANTRTEGAATEYPTDVPFGVWSYSLPADKLWIKDSGEASPVQTQEEVTYDEASDLWKPKSAIKWISSDNDMSFFACSPYSAPWNFSKENGITIIGYDIDDGYDLMFSENLYDLNKTTSHGIVNVPFVKALADVEFMIRSSLPDGTTIKVKQMKVKNVATKGDFFSLPFARWENTEKYEDIIFYEGGIEIGHDPVFLGNGKSMIPQTVLSEFELICDVISGEYILYDQIFKTEGQMRWGVGKTCTYNFKVTTDLEFIIESSLND